MRIRKLIAVVASASCALSIAACSAQKDGDGNGASFPDGKQITIVVPYSAGGASDLTARAYAAGLEKELDTSVLVTNVTGSSGAIGLEQVRSSDPDGLTIAYMPVESTMLKSLGFTDLSTEDFKFLGRVMTIPAAITVKADSEWNTLEDFIKAAKVAPRSIQIGNSGTGSIWHIAGASLGEAAGVEFKAVPFDGAAPAITALLGGNIDAVAVSPSEVQPNVESGELKILAVLSEDHSEIFPDVPTAKEEGYDVNIQGWGGFAVTKDTPEDVVTILENASEKAMNTDDIKNFLAERGFNHAYLSGDEMDDVAAKELEYFSKLIPELGIVN